MKSNNKAQSGMKVTKTVKKTPLGTKTVERKMPINPGEAGKNFGKSSKGPNPGSNMGGAKNGKAMKGKCKGGC